MLLGCLEVLRGPIPGAAVDINWIRWGINSSLSLHSKIDGFWFLHTCCAVKELWVSPKCSSGRTACAGRHISGSFVKRKKNCCNEFEQWKKNWAKFDELAWTLLTVQLLIYGWANFQVFSLDAQHRGPQFSDVTVTWNMEVAVCLFISSPAWHFHGLICFNPREAVGASDSWSH